MSEARHNTRTERRPSRSSTLVIGALLGCGVGLLVTRTAFSAGLADVSAEGWWSQGLHRIVALRLGDSIHQVVLWTLGGAAAGLLAGVLGLAPSAGRVSFTLRLIGLLLLAGLLYVEGTVLSLQGRSAADRPHVVWIVIDALRADHLSCHGYGRDTSPYIDDLAARSARFESAISQESYTIASVASFFTSTFPVVNGVLYDEPKIDILGRQYATVAEVLKNAGYDTGAFVFNPHLRASFQFDQGFDVYDDGVRRATPDTLVSTAYETVEQMEEKVTRFLEDERIKESGRPKFLYLHYRDVHGPYVPPPPYHMMFLPEDWEPEIRSLADKTAELKVSNKGKHRWPSERIRTEFAISQYDGEIRYVDDGMERLFQLLAQHGIDLENSVVIFTSDHGEELMDLHPGDRPSRNHGRTLYMEQINVPLIISTPEVVGAGRVVEQIVGLVDVGPTILDAVGVANDMPDGFQGRSLLPLVRGEGLAAQPVFSGGNHGRGVIIINGLFYYNYEVNTKLRLTREDNHARRPGPDFVYRRGEELYSLEDRRQTKNLLRIDPGKDDAADGSAPKTDRKHAERMQRMLLNWLTQGWGTLAEKAELDDQTTADLRALGYLGGGD